LSLIFLYNYFSAFVFVFFSVFLLRVRMPEWVSQAASGGGGDCMRSGVWASQHIVGNRLDFWFRAGARKLPHVGCIN
jgi:hypothetical protein